MSDPIEPVIYNDQVITAKVEKTKDPNNGIVTTTTLKGSKTALEEHFNTQAAILNNLDTIKVAWGDATDPQMQIVATNNTVNSGGGKDSGKIDEFWEVDANIINDPVENNDYWKDADPDELYNAVQAYRNNDNFFSVDDKANELFTLFKKGITEVKIFNIVLRKVEVCATNSGIQPDYFDSFSVQELSVINPPAFIQNSLADLQFEFLKFPPKIRQLSKTKYQINSEWWGAWRWIGAFYPGGTALPTGG